MRAFHAAALLSLLAPSLVLAQVKTEAPPVTPKGFVKEFGTMWTFDAPPLAYWKSQYGFEADSTWLEHVRLAAVRIPGCSASIVDDRGLVITNQHCARSCISAVSPPDFN
jgi:hypothetical protein